MEVRVAVVIVIVIAVRIVSRTTVVLQLARSTQSMFMTFTELRSYLWTGE